MIKNKLKSWKKDKRGLEFKLAFFAVITASVVVIAAGVMVSEWNDTYDSGLTYDLENLDKLDEVSDSVQQSQGNVTVKTSFSETTNFEGTSLRGVFRVLNNIFTPFRVVFGEGGMIDSVTDRWGIPNYIRTMVVSMIIAAIIFALVAIFFRKPGGTA